ncbi:GDSL-type esterase/lipase family protein [Ammonicoccus fulvus]|uniref:GDSL-type esterase/lipase family protein n=1 Tax=Ammonicoccus fulvus TaxID=3138240 RepID=A0ABZ3FTV7_9ACTN
MKRRLVAILGAAALGLSALGGAAPASAAVPGAPYVALGDSIAAGTGNKPYVDADCLRSRRAHPELLAKTLGAPVDSEACSGATTTDVLTTQLPVADLGPATQLVTLTMGINNLGWQGVLKDCSSDGTSPNCEAALTQALGALSVLRTDVATVLEAIHEAAPNAQVVITGYPQLFGQFSGSCSVGNFGKGQVRVSADQANGINYLITLVNGQILAGVGIDNSNADGDLNDIPTLPVDVDPAFATHRLCDTGDRWISGCCPRRSRLSGSGASIRTLRASRRTRTPSRQPSPTESRRGVRRPAGRRTPRCWSSESSGVRRWRYHRRYGHDPSHHR